MGDEINFLGLKVFKPPSRQVGFATHRKPTAALDYVPVGSAHAENTFSGVIAGELCRLLISNSTEASFDKQVAFFRSKVLRRGYCMINFQQILSRFPWHRRQKLLKPREQSSGKMGKKRIHITTKHVSGLAKPDLNKIARCLNRHLSKHDVELRFPYTVGKNLFRWLHARTWQGG